MDSLALSSDQVVMKLVEMGFEKLDAMEAVKAVGKSCDDAVEYILKGHHRTGGFAPASSLCCTKNNNTIGQRAMPSSSSFSSGSMRQSSLLDHFNSVDRSKKMGDSFVLSSQLETLSDPSEELRKSFAPVFSESSCFPETQLSNGFSEASSTWEKRVNSILRNRFGILSLKSFQREALSTWGAHKDCLVLAATGSGRFFFALLMPSSFSHGGNTILTGFLCLYHAGKSLCFQIPALLTGKVVVVVSPLISLMHDQCMKLSRHKVSACFLGSGQLDNRIEQKAMQGMYQIIYVCPETVVRYAAQLSEILQVHLFISFCSYLKKDLNSIAD